MKERKNERRKKKRNEYVDFRRVLMFCYRRSVLLQHTRGFDEVSCGVWGLMKLLEIIQARETPV